MIVVHGITRPFYDLYMHASIARMIYCYDHMYVHAATACTSVVLVGFPHKCFADSTRKLMESLSDMFVVASYSQSCLHTMPDIILKPIASPEVLFTKFTNNFYAYALMTLYGYSYKQPNAIVITILYRLRGKFSHGGFSWIDWLLRN